LSSSLSTFTQHLRRLVTTDSSTPLTALLLILVREVGFRRADDVGQFALILTFDLLESDNRCGLLVNDRTETRLTLDNNVGDTHLAAKSREEDDELNGVDIVGDGNKRRLLRLNESNDVVQTVFDKKRSFVVLGILLLSICGGSSDSLETSLLLLLGLWAVLVKQLEELCSSVLIESVGELSNGRRDFKTLVKNDLLALKADIFRPLDETRQVSLGLNVLADTEVLGSCLEKRVLLCFGGLASSEGSGSGLLSFGRLVIETKSAIQSKKTVLRLGALAPCTINCT